MTKEDAAAALDGNEYGKEGSPELFEQMKAAGLVALFGYSDDNIEARGAEHEEVSAYDGTTILFSRAGMLVNKCADERCPYFEQMKKGAVRVKVTSPGPDGGMFGFESRIPLAPFKIMEEGDLYSTGVVIDLAEAVRS